MFLSVIPIHVSVVGGNPARIIKKIGKKMNKVILHIGLHKTATTFFQEKVWPLLENYISLTRPYTQHNHAFNKLQYADDSIYKKDDILNELKKIGRNNIVISDEALSGKAIYFSYINRSIIANRLKEVFPEATILLFLRDQKDILLSHYSSYIKNPYGTKTIKEVFWKSEKDYSYSDYASSEKLKDLSTLYYNTNDYYIHLDCFLYSYLVKLYFKLFENVEIILYEEFKKDKYEIIKRVENIIGEEIKIGNDDLEKRVNKKLTYEELEKKRNFNRYLKFTKSRAIIKTGKFVKRININRNKKINMEEYINKYVGDYYSSDNQKLRKLLPKINWNEFKPKYC